MEILENDVIGEVVAQDYRAASVFRKYGIDFCCQGGRTIQEACDKKQLNATEVVGSLAEIVKAKDEQLVDYNSWDADKLIEYILDTHHTYVQSALEEVIPYLNKLCSVHGESHPYLMEVGSLFTGAASALGDHMMKEEQILFPYILQLVEAKKSGSPIGASPFGTVQNPIQMMMMEHDNEGERFRRIATLTNNYTPGEDACNTHQVTFALLKEFEEDLHKHIHLENNILFPKAVELEKELVG